MTVLLGGCTFSICSFWLVEALTRAGRVEEARLMFEKMLGYANHVGLYAEEIGYCGEALGNFPQAFTLLDLISAAFNHCGFDSPQLAAQRAIPRPLRIRHFRMLLSGIQARPELAPRLKHSGVTPFG